MCKPFNLKKAKAGKPIQTRTGLNARLLVSDLKDPAYPVVVAIQETDGSEFVEKFTEAGFFQSDVNLCSLDLVMAPNK